MQLNEPILVQITEWNTGGLLTRVEVSYLSVSQLHSQLEIIYLSPWLYWISVVQGLRAFLPKAELMNRVNNYTELKENVQPITISQVLPLFSSLSLLVCWYRIRRIVI